MLKSVKYYLLILTSSLTFSQVNLDSIAIQKLKEEIKAELKAEANQQIKEEKKPIIDISKFDYEAYGAINYYGYKWETDKNRRNKIDVERLNLYLKYNLTPKIQFKSEIEFEHGGTGTTMSFDPLEEFGEFEFEVEKGGAVVLGQLHVLLKQNRYLNIKIGKFNYVNGNASKFDEPTEYSTGYVSEAENAILPIGWDETGIEISGDFKLKSNSEYPKIGYKAYIMSGLDNSGFNSLNWLRQGYQTRFEMINADNLAYSIRLDYNFKENNLIGINIYAGNTSGNRPKNDFTSPALLTFGDLHFNFEYYPFKIRGYGFYGYLQNSEALSVANRNISNNLNVKRTPVAENAVSGYLDIGYDVFSLFKTKKTTQLYLFGRYDYVDTMYKTQGLIFNNPKYERKTTTFGFNYIPHPNIVFKTHYAMRNLGSKLSENTFTIGLGFNI